MTGPNSKPATPQNVDLDIMTVTGPIHPSQMGATLPHEHLLVDFIGAEATNSGRWNPEEVSQTVLPYLRQARDLGVHSLLDCTPRFIGRDPLLLERLARESGLNILTNTGIYAAVDFKFVPPEMRTWSAQEFARHWIGEWLHGIEETSIRPGFIKIGVNPRIPLHPLEVELVRAAALTHLATGLTIVSHTGPAGPALEQLDILKRCGVAPSAFVWTHAQAANTADHVQLARTGAWISLDSISDDPKTIEQYTTSLTVLKHEGLLGRVLLSHDAGWYSPGEPDGGSFRAFNALSENLLPWLSGHGFTPPDLHMLLVHNPRSAFTRRLRTLETPSHA